MAKIICIAHQKGGVGKSTLTLNLALNFSKQVSTGVTDLDPQGTISSVASIIKDLNLLNADDIQNFKQSPYKVVFVDTPPYLIHNMKALFEFSDFVLIPCKMGVPDVIAIKKTIQCFLESKKTNPNLKGAIVPNMVKPNTKIKNHTLKELEKFNIPILSPIYDRVSYANSFLEGGVLTSNDKMAIEEINVLTNEILNLL